MTNIFKLRILNLCASISLISLIALCLVWELWLAPLHPGGSMLALKVLPLLAPLFGILHSRRYTHQWASMLILLYFTEGIVRATTEHGPAQAMAALEILLSLLFFASTVLYAQRSANGRQDTNH